MDMDTQESVVATTPTATMPAANSGSLATTAATAADAQTQQTGMSTPTTATSSKTLKRCLSVPIIRHLALTPASGSVSSIRTRSVAAAAAQAQATSTSANNSEETAAPETLLETPKKHQTLKVDTTMRGGTMALGALNIGIPRSNPTSREVSPAPAFGLFSQRTRRYSASYSPLHASNAAAGTSSMAAAGGIVAPLRLASRVSQLRQEECIDINSREVNHEREVHTALQISQSWEDLCTSDNVSVKSDECSNPLQLILPNSRTSSPSPSPTSHRATLRLPYGLSPSPTRRTFATRRSMSPIAMRPSQLGPVKRKFELDDVGSSNWNMYAQPLKKLTTESRGSSPVCQSPSSICPSPDSGTYEGRTTPKLFISKLCTSSSTNGHNIAGYFSLSTQSSSSSSGVDTTASCSLASTPTGTAVASGTEPMCISNGMDEGISITEPEEQKTACSGDANAVQPMCTELQDEASIMDDAKSETSSIGGCSSVSVESSSCDSGARTAATFLNKLRVDEFAGSAVSSSSMKKNFYINKQGLSGAKKFIVNHAHLGCAENAAETTATAAVSSTNGSNKAETPAVVNDMVMCQLANATN